MAVQCRDLQVKPTRGPQKPLLVLVTGLQGTGKSTIAAAAGEELGAAVLGHDWAMSGLRRYPSLQEALDAMSPPGHREVGWSILGALARAQLQRGASVVLDGVARQAEVDLCRRLAAAEAASPVVILTTCADASIHRSRVEGRARGIPDWYELDWPHVERAISTWEAPLGVDLELDAGRSLAENLELLKTILSAATSSGDLRADPAYLAKVAYADDHLLRDRVSLYDHQQPRIDLVGEAMRRLGDLNAKLVADIGCGNGTYLRALSEAGAVAVGVDLSTGMLRAVPGGPGDLVLADAQSLPLRTACVDAAMAMHMLYHVPEPALAVREAKRVIKPDGRFIAAIGGPAHLGEARQLWSGLVREARLSQELHDLGLTNTRLSVPRLEELLRENFSEVHLSMLTSHVVLTTAAPLAKFAASTTAAKLATARGTDMSELLATEVETLIATEGAFRVTTEVALFTALVGS